MSLSQRRTVVHALREWSADGRPCVLATVVSTTDSAPRGLGAQLAITEGDLWVGGLSGGCAEVAVLAEATRLLHRRKGEPALRGVHITLTRDELGAAGPVCGATLGVLVEQVDATLLEHLENMWRAGTSGAWARAERTYVRPSADGPVPATGDDFALALEREGVSLVVDGAARPEDGPDAIDWTQTRGQWTLDEAVAPAPRLVVGGAGDIAVDALLLARQLGWRTVLVDPRSGFVAQTVAAVQPDVVLEQWPDRALASLGLGGLDACVAVAHDTKVDLPFLAAALRSPAFYVGSVGSRVVQHERRTQLLEEVGHEAAQRHRGPVGLNLGGSSSAEIALSILAEATAVRNGRSGAPLHDTREAIRAR